MKSMFSNSMKCVSAVMIAKIAAIGLAAGLTASVRADPLLVDGSAECYQKGFKPEQAKVALDAQTRALFLRTPCGWQFFRVISVDEMSSLYKTTKPIGVPQTVMMHTLAQLNELRIAQLLTNSKSH